MSVLKSKTVASPCVSICALDENDVCVGCYRTGREISWWGRLEPEAQQEVVDRSRRRMEGKKVACLLSEE